MRPHLLFTAASLATTLGLNAAQQPSGGSWSGDVELGAAFTSGNTDVDTINGRADVDYQVARWLHTMFVDAYVSDQDGTRQAERYTLGYKPRFFLTRKIYAFGLARADLDEFAGFDHQITEVIGLGRRILDTGDEALNIELGLGARQTDFLPGATDPGISDNEFVTFLGGFYEVRVSPSARFSQDLRVEVGADNTFVESITALGLAIAGDLSARISYTMRHNTDIEGARGANTDAILGVSLLYSF